MAWQSKMTLIIVALLHKFVYELRRNNTLVTQDNTILLVYLAIINPGTFTLKLKGQRVLFWCFFTNRKDVSLALETQMSHLNWKSFHCHLESWIKLEKKPPRSRLNLWIETNLLFFMASAKNIIALRIEIDYFKANLILNIL